VTLAQLLFSQGFGTRRECAGLVAAGWVEIEGVVCLDAAREVDPEGLAFSVRGEPWTYHARALLVMNKPAGHECSQKPKHHPSVYSLLPAPLRRRGVQAIGRLDEDTTGVLLFTDDGTLIHRLTSPKHHVPKVYEVGCKHPVDGGAARAAAPGRAAARRERDGARRGVRGDRPDDAPADARRRQVPPGQADGRGGRATG
jgi:16S rRNA pseudouridine516 synthase